MWIKFEDDPFNHRWIWVLSDEPTEIYDVYEYVNEIICDLNCSIDDIEVIDEDAPYKYSERDFPIDYKDNKANDFICLCMSCGKYFHGNKKRIVCCTCSDNDTLFEGI